jgi:hypothetical protein
MTFRPRLVAAAALGLGLVLMAILWLERSPRDQPPAVRLPAASVQAKPPMLESAPAVRAAFRDRLSGVSQIARSLNSPTGSIRRDLEILQAVFEAWQTNFPHQGNPVGDNAEITAALTGSNSVRFGFIPPDHQAVNSRGELCDRWGTPFRFHQLSGTQMEIRSAGPDLKFGTTDDVDVVPPAPFPIVR